MIRRLTLLALLATGALAAAAPAQAAKPQRCNTLQGTVKLRTSTIKVVERKVNDRKLLGFRLFGCALPRGRVFRIGERGVPKRRVGDPNSVGYQLGEHAGTLLRIQRSFGDGIAQIQTIGESVVDLYDGTNRRFFTGDYGESVCAGTEGVASDSTPPVARVVLDPGGTFAVLYANTDPEDEDCYPNDGRALLVGFPANGGRVTLDLAPIGDLPADSITIGGGLFRWTNAGQPRTEPE